MKEKMLQLLEVIKAKRKVLLCVACAVLALIIALSVATAVKAAIVKEKISEKYDGEYYKWIRTESWGEFFAFKDGKLAVEEVSSFDGKEGDITAFSAYKVKVSLLENDVWIIPNGAFQIGLRLDGDKIDFISSDIRSTTLEEIESLRPSLLCGGHDWEETVISEATCTKAGETKKICKTCGATETYSQTAAHKYKNGVCENCGKEKPREKTALTANTWYTYTQIPALKVQNISVTNATVFGQGKGVYVTGYYFCAGCRTFAKDLSIRAPEFGYDVTALYSCDVCGHTTTVRMHLDG